MLYVIGGVVALASFGIGWFISLGWIEFTDANRNRKNKNDASALFSAELKKLDEEMDKYESRNNVHNNRNNRGFRRVDE